MKCYFIIIVFLFLQTLNLYSQDKPNLSNNNKIEDEIIVVPYDNKSNKSTYGGQKVDKIIGNNFGLVHTINERGTTFYGIIDKNGKQILPTAYSFINQVGKFIVVKMEATASLYNLNLQRIFAPEFSDFEIINDSLIIAQGIGNVRKLYNNKGTLYDIEGVNNVHLFNMYIPNSPEKYLLLEKGDGQVAIYDITKKKIIRNFGYCRYYRSSSNESIVMTEFSENNRKIIKEQLLGLDFQPLSPKTYKSLKFVYPKYYIANSNEKFGLIDELENIIIPCEYDFMLLLDNGQKERDFFVKKNGKYGVINLNLNQIIPLNYDSLKLFNIYKSIFINYKNGKCGAITTNGVELTNINNDVFHSNFSNNIVFTKGDSILSYSEEGKKQKSFHLKDVKIDLKSKFVLVKNKNNKYGVLDEHFEELIQFEYDKINYLDPSYQIFIVQSKEKNGVYRSKNFYPLKTAYDKFIIYGKYYLVKKNGKYGLLNSTDFHEILPCEYDEIASFYYDDNIIKVRKGMEISSIKVN